MKEKSEAMMDQQSTRLQIGYKHQSSMQSMLDIYSYKRMKTGSSMGNQTSY